MLSLYKKTLLLILIPLFFASHLFAQKLLTPSRQSSFYTYIYKIGADDVLRFYKYPGKDPDEKILQHPVDSFKTSSYWENTLPVGNYLKVSAEKNGLKYALMENHSAFIQILHNDYDQRFIVLDKQGNVLTNATVQFNGKTVSYDIKSSTWHVKRSKKENIIQADYAGVSNFFIAKEQGYDRDDDDDSDRGWFASKWASIKTIFRHNPNRPFKYKYKPKPYTGFMVFNKPKYKPNDTVKFKAFILQNKSKLPAEHKALLVKLYDGRGNTGKIIGKVNSYRDGGFEYSFALRDTLELDRTYTIALTDPDTTKKRSDKQMQYNAFNNPADLISSTFRYEEYELKATRFDMRVDKKEQWRGMPFTIYLKATDENNLPVPDGRVTLAVKTNFVSSYNNKHVFVPDTLWLHNINLDPVGETKLIIPDSIFPQANIDYQVDAVFLNSSNEERRKSQSVSFNNNRFNITTDLVADTLKATYLDFGKEIKARAIISTLDANDDTISKVRVILPSKTIINPNTVSYNIETDSTDIDVELKELEPGLSLTGERTADSLFVKVNNPRNLHFWYSVFADEKLIDAGEADKLYYTRPYNQHKKITFWVNYNWGGINKNLQAAIVYRKDLLSINVKQPVSIYPGQQVKTDIIVTDAAGQPVANADVTAWAITRKFEDYNPPSLPYMAGYYHNRKVKKEYETGKADASGSLKLNWNRWSKAMGLDSIEYYKFTHPAKIYRIEEPGIDTITQIAPFIIKNGDVEPVHILYIDEKPVYFSQATQLQRYSFAVKPGNHTLRFRTAHQNIKLDSVKVDRYKKLILGINADAFKTDSIPDTLSRYEANLLNNYFISVVNNFDQNMALVRQRDNLFFLNPPQNNYQGQVLVGPITDNYTAFDLKDQFVKQFVAEPNYTYLFEPGLLKQKSIEKKYPFDVKLSNANGITDYTQYVLTQRGADSVWQNYLDKRSNNTDLFTNTHPNMLETGTLEIYPEQENINNKETPLIKNVIIYRYNDPDYIRIYKGNTTRFGEIEKGRYRIMYLLKGDRYDLVENIDVKPHGANLYKTHIAPIHARDSVSIKINNVITHRPGRYDYADNNIINDALLIKEAFNDKYASNSDYKDLMTGTITAKDDKLPIPGVFVRVKGTSTGTVTNTSGNFSIRVPISGKLIISFIGYLTKEINIATAANVNVTLEPQSSQLSEVVVTAYGVQRKAYLTGSVSVVNGLLGRVSGLSVIEDYNDQAGKIGIRIRGVSATPGQAPLYIIDGNIVESLAGVSATDISDINVLKSSAAVALYGARAANGVVIINTKKKADETRPVSPLSSGDFSLRKNFADYAYWQPKLATDAYGRASFTATFPDDITNWHTFIAGITTNQQAGITENQIKSFKPISANFIAPQFAVAGDEMKLIGKVMNYNTDAVNLTRTFTYNGQQVKQDAITVTNAKIDTLGITASATDSLNFEYTIKRDNGYFDGERRKVPVIKQGVEETKGIFNALNSDTTVNMKFDPAMGPVTFRAEASVLPTLAEEAGKLRDYKYLCNEQLASKLKGLLSEKRIKKFLGEDFKYEKNIKDVIKKLQENRRPNGTWGWWKDTDEELWISLHAVEALLDAQKEGYVIQLDKQKLTDYLIYQLESYRGADKLTCLELLHKLEAKVDYAKYIDIVEKENKAFKLKTGIPLSAYDKLRLMLVKQETGLPVKLDSLYAREHRTLFGNIYWGDDSYRFFDNSIQLSVLAYHIIKAEGKHPELLRRIQGYFLEQRSHGEWRNTYESALILETILPDLLVTDKQIKPSAITIKGTTTQTIAAFPYSATFNPQDMSVSKTGSLPVYITGSQKFWNSKPEKVNKEFTVDTWFERQEKKLTNLKGGEVVQLKTELTSQGDADFVMIEIPIPAGCSYESKDQPWSNNEVHREYFKEKVSIFCRKLKQGKYTFTVNLIPRYDGKYTLNPAKAEMMYFPVFYGREGMKQVVIGSLSH